MPGTEQLAAAPSVRTQTSQPFVNALQTRSSFIACWRLVSATGFIGLVLGASANANGAARAAPSNTASIVLNRGRQSRRARFRRRHSREERWDRYRNCRNSR